MPSNTARRCPPARPACRKARWQALLQDRSTPPGRWWTAITCERRYRLPDFATGLALVNRIGALAEAQDHHPDLLLAWGRVEITLWTHSVGGLSRNDFILAAHIDRLTP